MCCCFLLVRSDTRHPGVLAPGSAHQQNKTEEVDVEHTLLKTLLPPMRLYLGTMHQKQHLHMIPAWLGHNMLILRISIDLTSAPLATNTSREDRL